MQLFNIFVPSFSYIAQIRKLEARRNEAENEDSFYRAANFLNQEENLNLNVSLIGKRYDN